MSKLSYQLLSG